MTRTNLSHSALTTLPVLGGTSTVLENLTGRICVEIRHQV
jgi:hypothetical protein